MIRVTEPLNYFSEPWKLDWYAKNGKAYCNRISKASMKIGTEVDSIIKKNIEGAYLPTKHKSKEVSNCLEAYQKWYKIYQPKSIVNGVRLFNTVEGNEVTGEPDIYVDGVLVDIKCSSKISIIYWIQVMMYRWLEQKFGQVAILRLDKQSGSYEYIVRDYDGNFVDVWIGLMRAYVLFNKEELDGVDIREETCKQEVA